TRVAMVRPGRQARVKPNATSCCILANGVSNMSTKQQSLSDALITARKAIAVLAEPEAKIAETAATLKTARQEHAERIAVAAASVGTVVRLMTAASSTGKIKRIDVVRAIHPDFPNAERWTEIKKTASDKRTDEER